MSRRQLAPTDLEKLLENQRDPQLKLLLLLLQLRQTLSDTQAKHEEEFTKRAEHAVLTDMRAANQQKTLLRAACSTRQKSSNKRRRRRRTTTPQQRIRDVNPPEFQPTHPLEFRSSVPCLPGVSQKKRKRKKPPNTPFAQKQQTFPETRVQRSSSLPYQPADCVRAHRSKHEGRRQKGPEEKK